MACIPLHIDTSDGLCSIDSSHDTNVNQDLELVNVQKLIKDLRELLQNPERCDIKFLAGLKKETVYAVSSILMARSGVFREIIQSHKKTDKKTRKSKSTSKKRNFLCKIAHLTTMALRKNEFHMDQHDICLPDIEGDILRNILEYCYTGSVRGTVANAVDVMNAAVAYDLTELSNAWFLFARSKISHTTALHFLSTSCKYEDVDLNRNLQNAILDYIGINSEVLLKSLEFQTLSRQVAVLVIFHRNLEASDESKWDAVFRWSKQFADGKGDVFLHKTLKFFVRRIRFENIGLSKVEKKSSRYPFSLWTL